MSFTHIDNLECLGHNVTHLYLQNNSISVIENIECLESLRFLSLANNKIATISDMTYLHTLLLLDLSANAIVSVNTANLPQQLSFLSLKYNPCADLPGYRSERLWY